MDVKQSKERGRPPGERYDKRAQIKFEAKQWAAFERLAKQEGRSMSAIIRELVDRYLKRKG